MKLIKNSILYVLIFTVFVGSVGISVFAHFCSIKGAEYSYVIPLEDTCEKIEVKSCCSHEEEVDNGDLEEVESEKCCKEEATYYKLNTENFSKILKLKNHVKHFNSFPFFSELFPTIFDKEDYIAFQEDSPPWKKGKQILIENQVFRI